MKRGKHQRSGTVATPTQKLWRITLTAFTAGAGVLFANVAVHDVYHHPQPMAAYAQIVPTTPVVGYHTVDIPVSTLRVHTVANGTKSTQAAVGMIKQLASHRGSGNQSGSGTQSGSNNGPTYTVTSFGAVGDGLTDDTSAFQKALSALSATGGTLIIPGGSYAVDDSMITIPSNVSVVGENDATIVPSPSESEGWQLLEIRGSNIHVSGLTFDGENKFVRGITVGGGSSNVEISDTTVANFAVPNTSPSDILYSQIATGIRIEGDCNNITLNSDTINNIYSINGSSHCARGIWICPAFDSDGSLQGLTTDVTVENSTVEHVGPANDGDGIVAQGFTGGDLNLQILDNQFNYDAKRAIKIQSPGATIIGNQINNPFLNNNFAVGQTSSTSDMYSGISVYADDVQIENNTIGGIGSYYCGIELGTIGNAFSNITVTGNSVTNGPKSNIQSPSTSVRGFGQISNLTIQDNDLVYSDFGVLLQNAAAGNSSIASNSMQNIKYPNSTIQTW